MEKLTTTCICGDSSHIMDFFLSLDDDCPELYISVQLNQRHGTFGRLWIAIQYVFGKRSRFGNGHWDSGGLSVDSAIQLQRMIDKYIQNSNKIEQERLA